jgi:hypothetical protein
MPPRRAPGRGPVARRPGRPRRGTGALVRAFAGRRPTEGGDRGGEPVRSRHHRRAGGDPGSRSGTAGKRAIYALARLHSPPSPCADAPGAGPDSSAPRSWRRGEVGGPSRSCGDGGSPIPIGRAVAANGRGRLRLSLAGGPCLGCSTTSRPGARAGRAAIGLSAPGGEPVSSPPGRGRTGRGARAAAPPPARSSSRASWHEWWRCRTGRCASNPAPSATTPEYCLARPPALPQARTWSSGAGRAERGGDQCLAGRRDGRA